MSDDEAEKGADEDRLVLVREYMDVGQGKVLSVLTLFKHYRIWKAWDGRWRWVHGEWRDDDFGLQSHGAARTLRGVVISIIKNRDYRREFYGRPKK